LLESYADSSKEYQHRVRYLNSDKSYEPKVQKPIEMDNKVVKSTALVVNNSKHLRYKKNVNKVSGMYGQK
jgi:hypothetical protein